MDETGRLPIAVDRFFAVGMLKCPEPAVIQRPLQELRDRRHFRSEIKWYEVTPQTLSLYQDALDCFFNCGDASFACFIADKASNNPLARFKDQWQAYEKLASQLLIGNIGRDEMVAVLADEYSTPHTVTFEENVRALVESRLKRKAIVGICRMRSTGVDLFQLLDLLLGAVAYEYKRHVGVVPTSPRSPKARLLAHIQSRFTVNNFVGGARTKRLNVAEYGST
jgi:hypothetical protein